MIIYPPENKTTQQSSTCTSYISKFLIHLENIALFFQVITNYRRREKLVVRDIASDFLALSFRVFIQLEKNHYYISIPAWFQSKLFTYPPMTPNINIKHTGAT
jgi:hypothetical protein